MATAIRNFLLILAAALSSLVLGGLFAAMIAWFSPEFVESLFMPRTANLVRYAAAVGAIWGIFLGAGCMILALFVVAIAHRAQRGNNAEKR